MKIKSSVISLCTLAVLSSACVDLGENHPFKNKKKSNSNRVTNEVQVNKILADGDIQLKVVSAGLMDSKDLIDVRSPMAQSILESLPQGDVPAESIASKEDERVVENKEESLILGFPLGLVGEQNIFGGVITKVSDVKNEFLGGLKLTDLAPVNVRTLITRDEKGDPQLTLIGCVTKCDEEAEQSALLNFPILGLDQKTQMLMVDLAPIGKELDLLSMLDPEGKVTKLKAISSTTTSFDFSYSTLIFDVKSQFVPVETPANDPAPPITEFTVRWYLKLSSGLNPAFTPRSPTKGVGYFLTERSATPKITRFSTTSNGSTVHYYIKNVPDEFKDVFAGALDNWNVEFKGQLGRKLLSYEFIDSSDPRHAALVPGDIRYNIIEWDLENKAPYGGLGPSIANQLTGEILSANVLIQGPTIIGLYTKWFGVSAEVRELKRQGLMAEANTLMKSFHQELALKKAQLGSRKFALKLGKSLPMNIHSQRPELQDPIFKGHFEIVPQDVTYEEYMKGYFTEMLEHEIGHNLGLRHNFKGNLGAYENGAPGSVSRSIMEYLGRPYRHLNAIGLYDKMAIAFGYKGVSPKHLDWFCTDEDQPTNAATMLISSPECSKSDATSDPYSFWEGRLTRALDMVLDMKTSAAPLWTVKEIADQVDEALLGLSAYAMSAKLTSGSWTNFFGKGNRPEAADDVKAYVLESFKSKLCNPKLKQVIDSKENPEAKKLAQDNLNELQKRIADKTIEWKLFKKEDFICR